MFSSGYSLSCDQQTLRYKVELSTWHCGTASSCVSVLQKDGKCFTSDHFIGSERRFDLGSSNQLESIPLQNLHCLIHN